MDLNDEEHDSKHPTDTAAIRDPWGATRMPDVGKLVLVFWIYSKIVIGKVVFKEWEVVQCVAISGSCGTSWGKLRTLRKLFARESVCWLINDVDENA